MLEGRNQTGRFQAMGRLDWINVYSPHHQHAVGAQLGVQRVVQVARRGVAIHKLWNFKKANSFLKSGYHI
jgi:hypothetical protein